MEEQDGRGIATIFLMGILVGIVLTIYGVYGLGMITCG